MKKWKKTLRHINFSSAENKLKHVMMVPSVAKWSFILLFGKPFSCSKLLSKVFTKMINIAFVDIWEGMGAHCGLCGRGRRVGCLGRPEKEPVKGRKEERKGGEYKVKWLNRATRKTAKWAWVSVGNCFVRLSWTAICASA